jgi:hypothetical protein
MSKDPTNGQSFVYALSVLKDANKPVATKGPQVGLGSFLDEISLNKLNEKATRTLMLLAEVMAENVDEEIYCDALAEKMDVNDYVDSPYLADVMLKKLRNIPEVIDELTAFDLALRVRIYYILEGERLKAGHASIADESLFSAFKRVDKILQRNAPYYLPLSFDEQKK